MYQIIPVHVKGKGCANSCMYFVCMYVSVFKYGIDNDQKS